MMKVLVTGGTGFIGHAVVRELVRRGHRVRCLVRTTSDTTRIDGLDIELVFGDILNPTSVSSAIEGCNGVIHLASISDWRDINSPEIQRITVQGSKNVLDVCKSALSKEIRAVFISSISAINGTERPEIATEETPYSVKEYLPFSETKLEMESLCREAAAEGHAVMIANPPETYGPNDTGLITARNLINLLKTNPVLVTKGGGGVGHLDDVAAGIAAILEKGRPGERYILAGENLTVKELAELMLDILQLRRRVITVPTWLINFVTRSAVRLGLKLPYTPEIIPYATRYWFMDSSKAQKELGVSFRPARETLRPALEWMRQAGHLDGLI